MTRNHSRDKLRARHASLPRVSEDQAELGGDDFTYLRHRPQRRPDGPVIRVVDLFAGCGGLSLGFEEAARASQRRSLVVLCAEIDPKIREVYRANFPTANIHAAGNVDELLNGIIASRTTRPEAKLRAETGRVDILIGGPPCQGHSNLNNHTRQTDQRNDLYLRMVRAAEIFDPHSVCIENVPGVTSDRRGVVYTAQERLEKLGYMVDSGVLDISSIGVPQLRFRHLLIASKRTQPSVQAIAATHRVALRSLAWAIGDLSDTTATDTFNTAPRLSADNARRARWMLNSDIYDLPNRLRPACHRDKPHHKYKSMYGRLSWDLPAQTITTGFGSPGQGRYLHPDSPRTITPHEAARIQFFPDWFDFSCARSRAILAKCIGNAVPPKVGFAVGRYLLALFDGIALPVQSDDSPPALEALSAE